MKVRFWGTRGSLPASVTSATIRTKITEALKATISRKLCTDSEIDQFIDEVLPFSVKGSFGGNTACVEIQGGREYILCDAGTGLRDFGNHIMKSEKKGSVFNIFLSHLHWDHIQGFPFFTPAYLPGNTINIYGFHSGMEKAFTDQQSSPFFPIPLGAMKADIIFHELDHSRDYEIAGFSVRGIRQCHPGDSFGYTFIKDGKKIVYSTDSENKDSILGNDHPLVNFYDKADLLIFDAQYTLMESVHTKENWGHSSNVLGVEISVTSGVKHLCLFHNEPAHDDARLEKFLEDARNYLKIHAVTSSMKIDLAYDGLEIDV